MNIEEAKKATQGSQIRVLGKIVSPYDSNKVYAGYECVTDPTMKAVINVNNIQEDTEVYQKLWTTARNPLKIGRFINSMLPLTGKTYTNSEKEKFVSEWKSYVDPEDYFDEMNVSIHGINETTVNGAPTFNAIAGTLRSMLEGKVTVCHTHFDRVAIGQAFRKHNAAEVSCRWLDSAKVARRAWEECAGFGRCRGCDQDFEESVEILRPFCSSI